MQFFVTAFLAGLLLMAAISGAQAQSGRRRDPPPPPKKTEEKAKEPAEKKPPEENPAASPTVKKGAEIAEQQEFPEIATTRLKMKNGLVFVVREKYSQPLVAVGVIIKTGRLNEPDDLPGVATLTERMLVRGTPTRSENRSLVELRSLGGIFSAETGAERTVLSATLPAENVLRAVEIFADVLQHPVFDADQLKREADIASQEEKFKLDRPAALANERALSMVLAEEKLRREVPAAEVADALRSLTREQLVEFHRAHYRAENIVITIVGAVNTVEVMDHAQKLFGDFEYVEPKPAEGQPTAETKPAGSEKADEQKTAASTQQKETPPTQQKETQPPPPQPPPPAEPQPPRFRYAQDRGDVAEALVTIAHHAGGLTASELVRLQVLAAALGQGRASRLSQALRERRGFIFDAEAEATGVAGVGELVVRLRLDPEYLDRAEVAYFEEIERLRREWLSPGELQRAKSLAEKEYLERLAKLGGEAERLAHQQAFAGDFQLADKFVDSLSDVTAEHVQQVAAKYLRLTSTAIHEYLPTTAAPRQLDAAGLSARLAQAPGVKETEVPAAGLKRAPEVTLIEQGKSRRPEGESGAVMFSLEPEPLRDYSVFEGPRAFVREDHSHPLVTVGVFFQGGRLFESPANSGITELMVRSILKGSAGRATLTASEVALRLEQLGGEVTPVNEPDFFGFLMTVLSRNQDQATRLLIDLIEHPAFLEAEIVRERAELTSDIRHSSDDPANRSRELMAQALYGDLPYGTPRFGREESVKTLTPEQVKAWYVSIIGKQFPLVVIVGDTDGSALISSIVARDVRRSDTQKSFQTVTPKPPTEQAQRVEQRDRRSVVRTMGFLSPPGQSNDYAALTVLQQLGFGPGSRAMTELRHRQALAPTLETSVEPRLLAGNLAISFATLPENEAKARQVVENHIARLIKDPVSDDEFRFGLNASLGDHARRFERPKELALEYARTFFFSSKPDAVEKYDQKLRAVTAAEVQRVATSYLKLSQSALGVVRVKEKK
jgi:zinc protease